MPSHDEAVGQESPPWDTVKEALGDALDLGGRDRAHFLDQLERRSPSMAQQVRALLEAHADSGDFLERSPTTLEGLSDEAWLDRRVGAYRIYAKGGEGGMGRVFRARRDDGAFEREVAIKVVAGGAAWLHNLDLRLARERNILASLDHPAIARLLDGGTTEDGFAFLVLEWVQGQRIDTWCDERECDLRQRIELLCGVCEAVAFAHTRLVVHGDLKPSNLLVQEDGTVKLLDFGIAELLSGGENDDSGAFPILGRREAAESSTGTGSLDLPSPFTPRYASPEQRRGESVGTLSDVYSLGVVAHVLLTGLHPETGTTASARLANLQSNPSRSTEAPERLARICSRRSTTPGKLLRGLRGDLDAILRRALAEDPADRYANVPELADDLRNFLEHRPISALPVPVPRRVFLWSRRSPVLATAVLGLVLAAIGLGFLSHRLAQQRRVAMNQRAAAEEVAAFTVDLFDVVDRADAAAELSARALIEQGELRLVERLRERPRMRARLLHTLGTAAFRIGLDEKARSLWGEAVEIRRQLVEDNELLATGLVGPEELENDTAESLVALADVALRDRAADQAEPLLREAIERLEAHPTSDRSNQLLLATAESRLGLARMRYGDRNEADHFTLSGLERCFAAAPAVGSQPGCWTDVGVQIRSDRAGVLLWSGEQQQGLRWIDEARRLLAELKGERHPRLHALDQNRALIRFSIGEITSALEILEASSRRLEESFGSQHPQTLRARNLLINAYAAAGLDRAARRLLREQWSKLQAERAASEVDVPLTAEQLWARRFLGYLEASLGDIEASLELLNDEPPLPSLDLATGDTPEHGTEWAQEERRVLEWRITLELARDDLTEALQLAQLLNRSRDNRDPSSQELELLAAAELDNRLPEARPRLERVRDLYRDEHPATALIHLWPAIYLSELELLEGRPEQVGEHLDAAAISLQQAPEDSWLLPAVRALRAASSGDDDRAREALAELETRLSVHAVEVRRLRRALGAATP